MNSCAQDALRREPAALLLPLVEWTVVHAEEILGPA